MAGNEKIHFVIIGNGVSGINAALTIREKAKRSTITVISKETHFFFSRTALMYIAMNKMRLVDTEPYERNFYKSRGINLVYGNVEEIDIKKQVVKLSDQKDVPYTFLLLATGATVATPAWPGLDLNGVVSFISYQDLEDLMRMVKKAQHAVVIGGGLIGIELCEVFKYYNLNVLFLIRDPFFWKKALSQEEGKYVQQIMTAHGVNIVTGDELKSINEKAGSVCSITTKSGKLILCDIAGIATGVRPEISLAEKAGISCNNGILTDWCLQTSIPGIFAAGDCVEIQSESDNYRQTIWYTARDMGKIAGNNMCGGTLRYEPGEWYNSAMFFDKEYTVVGRYGALKENETEYLYQDKHHSIRIILENNIIKGFSMIGSRWDHIKLIEFIREKRDLDYFLHHYRMTQFNPEFYSIRIHDL